MPSTIEPDLLRRKIPAVPSLDGGFEIGSDGNEDVNGYDDEWERLEPVLLTDTPLVLDHHEANAPGESGIEFRIMEPAVHIEIGLVVERPFSTGRDPNLDCDEVGSESQRKREEHHGSAEFCPPCKFVEKYESDEDSEHGNPLIDSHISINMEQHNCYGLIYM